jgi:hypothetical protein
MGLHSSASWSKPKYKIIATERKQPDDGICLAKGNHMKTFGALALVLYLFVGGCASEVTRHASDLSATSLQPPRKLLCATPVSLTLDSGYERKIGAGTEFLEIGRLTQGIVLKPLTTVFTVEGAHMHEAYLVVASDRVVGFYLPVEHAFSPLSQSVVISLQERKQ